MYTFNALRNFFKCKKKKIANLAIELLSHFTLPFQPLHLSMPLISVQFELIFTVLTI